MSNPEKFTSKIEYKAEKEGIEDTIEQESLISENFEIYYDNRIKKILEDGDNKKFDEIKDFVDKMIGSKWDMKEKSKIYLFSDEKEYSEFLKKNFPDINPESATFDKETKTVFKFISILEEKEIEKYKDLLKEKGISKNDMRNTSRADIFSGVGHELTHLHPFFGGIGNEESENKWEQEMVCIFIGENIRTDFGNERFRKHQFLKAQEELKELEKENQKLSWETVENDWENFTMWERFVYSWLEKNYGLEKLQNLWQEMFKNKKTITEAIKDVYNKEINDLQENFKKDMLKAENYSDIEKLE